MPGMSADYAISAPTGGLQALSALCGTIVGSIVWGRLGDLFGHLMLSVLLIALPMALARWMLARDGIETRGYGLEAIQDALSH